MIKLLRTFSLFLSTLLTLTALRAQTTFTSGNIVIFQADASANNTTATIIELNPALVNQTTYVSSFPIPGTSASATPLRFSGSAGTTGYLANSNDGTLLCFDGANSSTTTGNTNTIPARGVGTLDVNQTFAVPATYTGASGNQPRCATTLNNSVFYIGDQGGLYTNGATAASPAGNLRGVKAFGGTVYVGQQSSTATIIQVSTISAATGATLVGLPGLTNNNNFIDFCLVSSANNGTYDILYIISNTSATAGTISKYSLVSGTWTANGSAATTYGGFGLAARTNSGGADLYISSGDGTITANNVMKATDAAGYNATINITTTSTLYTAPTGTLIKGVALAPVAAAATTPGTMRITEYMYQGNFSSQKGEFVEFTNVGSTPVSMVGWSYDDNHEHPGTVDLSAFGTVQPGESVILTDAAIGDFRADWTLCNDIKIISNPNTDNLGRADEINLYDASGTLVDQLTYDDQTKANPRTQGTSAWVNAAGLGNNIPGDWTLSVVGDAEGSATSSLGEIGSPGKSTRAIVAFSPCTTTTNPLAPTIIFDYASTSNLLDQGVTSAPASPYAISGVINDPTDPASTLGIYFTVHDNNVDISTLTVNATSSNTTILPAANLTLTGAGTASYRLQITPYAVGYSTITVTVNNGTYTASYQISYASSQSTSSSLHWPTGNSDASDAIALDDNYMVIGDDEQNMVFVFNRQKSGLPVKTFDYNQNNILNLTDGSNGNYKELDVEAAAPSPTINTSTGSTTRTYWFGSMSNSSSFDIKPDRDRIVALDISGPTNNPTIVNAGYAANIRQQLIDWGEAHQLGFAAAAAAGQDPKSPDGFNIEGAVFAPDNTTLYYGFRAPLVPNTTHTYAVIAPLLNFETWFANNPSSTAASFGDPIQLDLGGRGIRDIIRLTNGIYVIAAGSPGDASDPALYTWTGNAADAPVLNSHFNVAGLNVEGLLQVNTSGTLDVNSIQVITDNGSTAFYNDGVEAKDLTSNNFKKFSTGIVTSPFPLPIGYQSFTAQRAGNNARLSWTIGISDIASSFDIMRSTDGTNFNVVHTEPGLAGQNSYAWTDENVPTSKLYYRIRGNEPSGQQDYSTIRVLAATGSAANSVSVYPNPVINGTFTLAFTASGLKSVSIYNSAGLLIQQSAFADNAKDFSTTGWAKGLYLLRIILPDGSTTTEKLTIN